MSSRTRQEHANGMQSRRPGPQGHGTWLGEQVSGGAGMSVQSRVAPGSCQRLAIQVRQPHAALCRCLGMLPACHGACPASTPGAGSPHAACQWARSRPAPRCPFPFLSPCWSLNLNEGLTDGRAVSASWRGPGERCPGESVGCCPPPHAWGEGGPPALEASHGTSWGCFGAGLGVMAV